MYLHLKSIKKANRQPLEVSKRKKMAFGLRGALCIGYTMFLAANLLDQEMDDKTLKM